MSFNISLSGRCRTKIWMLPVITLRTPVPLVLNNPELNLRMYFLILSLQTLKTQVGSGVNTAAVSQRICSRGTSINRITPSI